MKFLNILILCISFCGIALAKSKELPTNFKACKRNDPALGKCLISAVSDALPQLKNGLPEFGILPIDPLAVNSLSINQGSNSPINLKQEYKNIELLHLSESKITKYWPDLDHYRLRAQAYTPKMEFLGDYTMEGRILVLPITGKGRSNITMLDLTTKHELIGEPIKKNGELFMKIKSYKIKFEPKKVLINFENLFNGDKLLADNMNSFLNENWEIVFNELKAGYEETFGLVFKDITNKIFTKIPLNKIFSE